MKKGWILSAKKPGASACRSKIHMSPKERVEEKVTSLKQKTGDKVYISANTPYLEIEPEQRVQIRVNADGVATKSILRVLGQLEPLLISSESDTLTLEVNGEVDELRQKLLEADLSQVTVELVG